MFDAIRKWATDSEMANSISTLKQIFNIYLLSNNNTSESD